jgi:hypothetical protein
MAGERARTDAPRPRRGEGDAGVAGRVVFAPILHGSLPFALAVRQAFFRERPHAVAVELPETLTEGVRRAIRRMPLLSVLRWQEASGEAAFLLLEVTDGIVEALRLAEEHGIPSYLVDRDTEGYRPRVDRLPDPYAVERIGYDAYVDLATEAVSRVAPDREDELREATMAYRLDELRKQHDSVLFVVGLAHAKRVERRLHGPLARPLGRLRREGVTAHHLHREASREVLSEPGFIQGLYEGWRKEFPEGVPPADLTDRYQLTRSLFETANARMLKEDGESVSNAAIKLALRFARNQAIVRSGLAPTLFETTVAARGVHSDDFAWHVWELANDYPHQADPADLPAYRLTLEELERGARHIYFRRRIKARRHTLRLVRTRQREPAPGEWSMNGQYLCSHPPEDLRIEAYSAMIRKKARGMLSAERSRTLPFSTSLCDGIDLRETIRMMAFDGRLFVREEQPMRGNVGAIVVIFDEDRDNRYPWTMTWQGEHEQESDMALYATSPEGHVVGPGIGRSEYGGFLMTYPPGRMFRIFEDPYFEDAETKAERLLLAGIDYSSERWIVYIAKKAPRARWVRRAKRMGKQVMYLPIGQLSPVTLRELRIFHVLDGKEVRGWAKEYIG